MIWVPMTGCIMYDAESGSSLKSKALIALNKADLNVLP